MTTILSRRKINILLLWFGWLLLLGLAVGWRWQNIDAFGVTNDEGAYLMWARLVAAGFPLYTETYVGSPPLFLSLLAWLFKLVGFGVVTGRVVVLVFFVILAGLVGWLGRRLAGWIGAYAGLILLALLPPFFALSRQVMLEVPAMTLALASVGCGYLYFEGRPCWRWGRHGWLPLAGGLLAASFLIKFLHPLAGLPILIMIWGAEKSWWERCKAALWFGSAFGLVCLAVISLYDVPAFLDQVIFFRAGTRQAGGLPLAGNGERLLAYGLDLWGLSLLTLAGLVSCLRQGCRRGLAWAGWLGANLLLVLWYQPLFPHHFTLLLPGAILLGLEFLSEARRRPWGWGLVLLALLNLPAWVAANQAVAAITTGGREAEAARLLNQVTRPDDFVMADSQLLALWADRRTPPPLLDFSLVAIQSGRQNTARLLDMSADYSVAAVAPWALRMVWLPDYLAWAADNFWVHKVWDNDHQLFFGPKHPSDRPIPNRQLIRLEKGITLAGHTVDTATVAAGRPLPMTLYWQTETPVETDYTIFVQILDSSGLLVAQNDSQPLYGYFPTSQWPAGAVIPDRVTISLPENLPPGQYAVVTGMYELAGLERLPLVDSEQDYVQVTEVTIGQ